jgi:hypothetical protein
VALQRRFDVDQPGGDGGAPLVYVEPPVRLDHRAFDDVNEFAEVRELTSEEEIGAFEHTNCSGLVTYFVEN